MKRLAFLALLLATACGTDVERAPTGNGDGNLQASVDGATYTGSLNTEARRNSGNVITITGFGSNNRRLAVRVVAAAAGTFQLTGQNYGEYIEGVLNWSTANSGGTGSVTFSRLDARRATGTFLFTAPATTATGATGTKNVTSGNFDVQFPE